jgi:hypothetical protein
MAVSQLIAAKHDKGDIVATDLVTMEKIVVEVFLRRTKEYCSTSSHEFVTGKGR